MAATKSAAERVWFFWTGLILDSILNRTGSSVAHSTKSKTSSRVESLVPGCTSRVAISNQHSGIIMNISCDAEVGDVDMGDVPASGKSSIRSDPQSNILIWLNVKLATFFPTYGYSSSPSHAGPVSMHLAPSIISSCHTITCPSFVKPPRVA